VNPFWSPDLNWIVFQSNRSGSWNVYLLNTSTGNEYQVTSFTNDAIQPTWSPNGHQLAFLGNQKGQWGLYVMDVDGKNMTQITAPGDVNTGNGVWSPEGNRIAYQSQRNGNLDIFTYDLKTKKEYRLTNYPGLDSGPTWDCGGANVSFTTTMVGNPDIYSSPWQGGGVGYMTNDKATDKWSEWSPSKEDASQGY